MPRRGHLHSSILATREQITDGRQKVREQHDRGLDGVRTCARLTTLVDTVVIQLYEAALEDLSTVDAEQLRGRVALVAHGGYGRRQQAPFSDVDLMILHEGKADDLLTQFACRLTQDIFDIGLQLGQSVRTPVQAIQMARAEPEVGTSLAESRLLIGDSGLYERYYDALVKMYQRRSSALSRAFIAARQEERLQYGETVYLLEPNVKRSRGGLRDLHLLRWLWFIKHGVADLDRLRTLGAISKFDHHRLVTSRSFLLRVRNEMHFHAETARDALARAEQVRLAKILQYRGREGMLPVEQFMRDYFHHTNHISSLAFRLSDLMQPTSPVHRVLEPVFGRKTEDDFQVGRREISATQRSREKLKNNLEAAMRLLELARQEGKRIAQDTWYFIYRAAPKYSSEPTPEEIECFLHLLDNPLRLGELLRRMHALGVLEKIIPDFTHARSLLQFNQYHKYTVDEHCIRAVEEATRFADREDTLGKVYRELKNKRLLHLALLIHDLGKGREEDHSQVGLRIAQNIAERFALPSHQGDTLSFLVEQHLSMSHLAFRRDTSQAELVTQFANSIESQDQLDMLFLLTCADFAAVGPGVLNSWKVEVLTDLYRRASRVLTSEREDEESERQNENRKAICDLLTEEEQRGEWFQRQLLALSESYLAGRSPSEVAETLRQLQNLARMEGKAWARYLPETEMVEFTAGIHQGRGRGIFSNMAGALSSQGLQIFAAETNTLDDGLLLLRYVVCDPDYVSEPPSERLDSVCNLLVQSIGSDQPPKFRTVWGREQAEAEVALTNLPHEVRIDNQLSSDCTIVEVFANDRIGLLYELSRALHELRCVIRFAKIGTYLDQVVDVFYLTERDGKKLQANERLEEIRQRLSAIIEPEHA